MNGKLIVIEGLDGSGKETQAKLLAETLEKSGKAVKRISFPCYNSKSAVMLKSYLDGEFGTDPNDVNAYAASTFFAIDRFASYRKDWKEFYENGGIVICDRYATSNAIHQCAKLPQGEWDGFIEWVLKLEYEQIAIPAPDTVIYLRVDPEISQNLISGRYQGDEKKKDIHESNLDYLMACRLAADYCSKHLNWNTVECVKDQELRTIEDIAAEILQYAEG